MFIRSVRIFRLACVLTLPFIHTQAFATDRYVAPGGTGNGSASAPFGRIQDAVNAAQPGDNVLIGPGTYGERIATVRGGTSTMPVTLRAVNARGSAVITSSGRVLTVAHPYIVVDSLVLDGQFGLDDAVRVTSAATKFILRNSEVRRTSRDAVDMAAPSDVLIENSLIHDALNAANGRTDAHGVVAGAAQRLTIRNTEIHTFSGDAIQIDPGRAAPGWTDLLVDGCRLWLQPLPAAVNGFAAGVVPGENALDTKADASLPRARLTVRNTEMYGFRNGLISNMAALNIKENVDAVVDGVTAHSSEIAFRLRGPAIVRVQNAVVRDVAYGVRYEDNIQGLRVWNSTFGARVGRAFVSASSSGSGLDVRNVAILGTTLPPEASGGSNLALPASAFVDVVTHNYQLPATSPANDRGVTIQDVATDRQGTKRPQGTAYDVGAYERVVSESSPDPGASAEIVLHAWQAPVIAGNWQVVNDATAAGGARLASIDLGAPTITKAKAAPADYFELTFYAEAGRPYRLWMRGTATANHWANDSVFAQFTDSFDASGRAAFRIGTTRGAVVNLEDCSGCGLEGWGWQDNGSGVNVLGPQVYFSTTGPHTIRVQTREDGFSVDQIVLSPSSYLTQSPGALKNDETVLAESGR
jgi:hypothetical protein